MKYFLTICTFIFVFFGFAQQSNFIKHTVAKGETITQIAQKYKVTPYEIYKLNPDSQKGVQVDAVLTIPSSFKEIKDEKSKLPNKTHIVVAKETVFSISKLYGVTAEALQNQNADLLKEGLKIDQVLVIPNANTVVKHVAKKVLPKENNIQHEVLPKETKYGIASKYGLTVGELELQNPQIVSGLTVGAQLAIKPKKEAIVKVAKPVQKITIVEPEIKVAAVKEVVKKEITEEVNFKHEVMPKETIFSITNLYGVSTESLLALNPELINGVKEGMFLKIPNSKSVVTAKGFTELSKTLNTINRKKLALLIPFNLTKLKNDSLNSIASKLKKDKFLNMTLDFYSGALMAIDSAKTLGLNLDVKIIDSQESKLSMNTTGVVVDNNLFEVNAIIGPFYQNNVEKVAELMQAKNVPVISPLSKEIGKSVVNLYQSMPTNDCIKNVMLDYLQSKNQNIIALIDSKRVSNKEFIASTRKDIKIIDLNDKLTVADSLKNALVKNKKNYVIMDTEKTGLIFATTNAMMGLMSQYDLQLVILESNPTLDFEEISLNRLTVLKMLYPSIVKDNTTHEANLFEKNYRKINKISPSQYAIRGFDVTLDTMLRLSQDVDFEATATNVKSQQIENKFEYAKDNTQGYLNKGVYILQYDSDLSIKEAN